MYLDIDYHNLRKMRAFGIILILLLEYQGSVNSERIEPKLINHLLNGYHVKSRPVDTSMEAVNVSIGMKLYQLIEIKEKLQYIKISAWIALKWTDCQLKWNPSDFDNIQDVSI